MTENKTLWCQNNIADLPEISAKKLKSLLEAIRSNRANKTDCLEPCTSVT